jgi:cytosine/adenosine deaminase-related metal-dependent hydrolase
MGIRCAATILSLFCALPAMAQLRAFTGATVIDGNGGRPIANGVVLIDGRKIKAVGAAGSISIPKDAERIDVAGKYIVPGLMDANVHLVPWPSWTYIEFLARYENDFPGIVAEAAQIALKHGFTTLFD